MNENKECWPQCGYKPGPCSWCGANGMCCRIGSSYMINGCDGTFGGKMRHECALHPSNALLPYSTILQLILIRI